MDGSVTLLEELSNALGPSGFENSVREVVKREMANIGCDIEIDGLGSVVGRLTGSGEGPRIMLAAHMDEVGLLVKYVTEQGYIKFETLGGWLDQAIINQRWVIMTKGGPVLGVTGIKTPHVMNADARGKVFAKTDMFIDVGARDRQDALENYGIVPGDPIAPDSVFSRLGSSDMYLGKAWDDRAGVWVMLETLKNLGNTRLNSVYGVATVQEEVGLRGAGTSGAMVRPQVGINIESGVAGDYPGITQDEAQERVGNGPGLFLHDSSMLPNLKLRDFVVETAEELGISLQFNVLSGYGQDGAAIQKTGTGVPVVNITVPTRYLHSHNSVVSGADLDGAVRLVRGMVERLNESKVQEITGF